MAGAATDHAGLPADVVARLGAWRLIADGGLVTTRSSWLLPVRAPERAMLKVARTGDELAGFALMRWWNGDGAAKVLAASPNALLLERAVGGHHLADMARGGEDDLATTILCATAARLHAARPRPPRELHPLDTWFRPLFERAGRDARLTPAAATARDLLAEPCDVTALHGDLHHGNVLDFGPRGWLAIDPHGLVGERFFDYANIFTNPDLDDPSRPVAQLPGRLEARLEIVTRTAGVERARMLQWIVAWTGLSAAWFLGDADEAGAEIDLVIGSIARQLLAA